MRRIDDQTINARFYQLVGAFPEITRSTNGRRYAQAAQIILRRCRILNCFLNVFDGNQALQVFVIIDDQKFFDAMFLQNCLGLIQRRANRNGDQRLLRHNLRNRQFKSSFESQITIGYDADQVAVFIDHGHAADVIALHHVQRFTHRTILSNRHRIDNHSGFGAFHFVDFFSLALDTEIFVNDADATLLGDRDRQRRFGHSVHRSGTERNLQTNTTRKLCRRVCFSRQHIGSRRHQQYIIKSQSLGNVFSYHDSLKLLH